MEAGPETSPSTVYWLTRDEDDHGVVSDIVDVWTEIPDRQPLPGGVGCMWLGKGVTGIENRYAQWTIELTRKNNTSKVIPDNSRECVRVG